MLNKFILSIAICIGTLNVAQAQDTETAIFAGGCFWCVESDFDTVDGVISTTSGYIGGTTDSPTYKNHTQGRHREAVEIVFDPAKVSYGDLVEIFWRSVNPTDEGGQFCDRGFSYTTAIYALNETQADIAQTSKNAIIEQKLLDKPVVTPIEDAATFWPAETYHQDYYKKNPLRYKFYRTSCGRDKQVEKVWGDMARAGLGEH
jgi:peptide-methionine (S)-S-oxide reductase